MHHHHHHQPQAQFVETIHRAGHHQQQQQRSEEDLSKVSMENRLDKHFRLQADNIQEEFQEYFNQQQLYKLEAKDQNDPVYGKCDVYRLKQEYLAKRSHHGPYPHWLPEILIRKSVTESNSIVPQLVLTQMQYLFQFHPELVPVFGEYEKSGSTYAFEHQTKVFLAYQPNTLQAEIQQRVKDQSPFDESLLWKMLYNLLRAQFHLSVRERSLADVYPSDILYNNFQVQVIQGGLVTDRPLTQERQQRNQRLTVAQQIVKTIVHAALLESNELAISEQNINDKIAQVAQSGKQLLANILGQLWNMQVQQNVQFQDAHAHSNAAIENIYRSLEGIEKSILFMDPNMVNNISQVFQRRF